MSELEALLAVQDRDIELDQLRHRLATLTERADVEALMKAVGDNERRAVAARAQRDELGGRQAALEREIADIDRRLADLDRRLHSGEVSATRELTAMVEQVDSLKDRKRGLEDDELEVMEALEPVDAGLATITTERGDLDGRLTVAQDALTAAEAVIDGDISRVEAARADAAAQVPDQLLATYERLRTRLGGVGAARLVGSSCSGCHLTLSATELDRIKHLPPGTLATCEQCGRLIVP